MTDPNDHHYHQQQTMMRLSFARRPFCRKFQTVFNLFLTLSWLSVLIYYLLGQWLDNPKPAWKLQKTVTTKERIGLGSLHRPDVAVPLMDSLGFVKKPKLFPQPYHQDRELPVFVLTLKQEDLYSFHRFLGSFRIHFPGKKLVVYNLGLDEDEVDFVSIVSNKASIAIRYIVRY